MLFRTRNCLTPGLSRPLQLSLISLTSVMGVFIKIDHLAYKRYLNFENSILFSLEEHSGMSPPPCHSLSLRLLPCQQSSHPSEYTLNDSFLRKISSSLRGTASP